MGALLAGVIIPGMILPPEHEPDDNVRPFADLTNQALARELGRELIHSGDDWRMRLLLLERDVRLKLAGAHPGYSH